MGYREFMSDLLEMDYVINTLVPYRLSAPGRNKHLSIYLSIYGTDSDGYVGHRIYKDAHFSLYLVSSLLS